MILRFQEPEDFYTFIDIAIRQFRKDNGGVRLTRGMINKQCGFGNSYLHGAKIKKADVRVSSFLTVCQLLGYEVILKKKATLDLNPNAELVKKARRSPRRSILGKSKPAKPEPISA